MEDIKSRKELNKLKEKTASFLNPYNQKFQFVKNEYGIVTTKSDITKITLKNQRARRLAKEKIKEVESKEMEGGGTVKEHAERFARPSVVHGITVPGEFKFSEVRSYSRLKTLRESAEKRSTPLYFDERMNTMKNNFITMLEESMNSDSDKLVEIINQMDSAKFFDLYTRYKSFDFDVWYSTEGVHGAEEEDTTNHINKMLNDIERYERNENKDLKSFPNG